MESVNPAKMTKAELVEKIGELQGRLAAIQTDNPAMEHLFLQEGFGLTPKEADFLYLFSDGKPHTKLQILKSIYADRPNDAPEIKIIDVYLCKMRKKVNRFGIEFETIWGGGYVLNVGLDVVTAARRGIMPSPAEQIPERIVPPRLIQERTGAMSQRTLAEIIRRCDSNGRATFEVREFAASIDLRKNLLNVIVYLEQRGFITVIKRATKKPQAVRRWTVRVAPHVLAGRR